MSDEDTLHMNLERAARANALWQDELLQEAFTRLEQDYVIAWRGSASRDIAGREKAFVAINVIGHVKKHLHTIIKTGELAKAELNHLFRTKAQT